MPPRGFSLLELLIALALGLGLMAAFVRVVQSSRALLGTLESESALHETARHALHLLVSDLEHAGFWGHSSAAPAQLVSGGTVIARTADLRQPSPTLDVAPVGGLPSGAHQCGVNFAVDLSRPVQASDRGYRPGTYATGCAPTASAGGAEPMADALTIRFASLGTTEPRAGRIQLYTRALEAQGPLRLFADGRSPGARDEHHEIRDVEVRTYYIARNSVNRPGWPALRVKALTESRGAVQFRDEEILPGVEDLQVQLGVLSPDAGEPRVLFVNGDSPRARSDRVVVVRLWLRLCADDTERGYRDERSLVYANVAFTPTAAQSAQRRLLVQRTVALRNP